MASEVNDQHMRGGYPYDLDLDGEEERQDGSPHFSDHDHEFKCDPSQVKAEVFEEEEEGTEDLDYLPGNHFLAAHHDSDGDFQPAKHEEISSGENEDGTSVSVSLKVKRKPATKKKGRKQSMDMRRRLKRIARRKKYAEMTEEEKKLSRGRRKKRSEMTPEELEEVRARDRTEAKRKRAKMTPEQLADLRKKRRQAEKAKAAPKERKQKPEKVVPKEKKRKPAKVGPDGKRLRYSTPEEYEAFKLRNREWARAYRQRLREQALKEGKVIGRKKEPLSPEKLEQKKRERYQKMQMRKIERRLMMTEEELKEEKQRNYLRHLERKAKMDDDKLATKRQRECERIRMKMSLMSEEERKKFRAEKNEKNRQRYQNLDPEKKAEHRKKLRENHVKLFARAKQDPEAYKDFWERHWRKKREINELWKKLNNGTISNEELEELETRTRSRNGEKRMNTHETPEERLQRFKEILRLREMRSRQRRRVRLARGKNKNPRSDERRPDETEAEFERRKLRNDIRREQCRARSDMRAAGATPEEIRKRCEEIASALKPGIKIRGARPRPRKRPESPNHTDETSIASSTPLEPAQEDKLRVPLLPSCSNNNQNFSTTVPSENRQNLSQKTVCFPQTSVPYHNREYQLPLPPPHFHSTHPAIASLGNQTLHNATATDSSSVDGSASNYSHSYDQNSRNNGSPLSSVFESQPSPHSSFAEAPSPPSHYADDDVNVTVTDIEKQGSFSFNASTFSAVNYANKKNSPTPTAKNATLKQSPQTGNQFTPLSRTFPSAQTDYLSQSGGNIAEPGSQFGRSSNSSYHQPGVTHGPQKNRIIKLPRNHMCDICGNWYNRNTIYEHKKLYHNPNFKDGRCTLCGEQFRKAKEWYQQHWQKVHAPPKPPPTTPPRRRKQPGEPRRNPVLPGFDPVTRPYVCTHCGAGFAKSYYLASHERNIHLENTERWKCEHCDRTFKHKSVMQNHKLREHNKQVYSCEICEQYFPSRRATKEHIKDTHPDSYFPCEFCVFMSTSIVGQKLHMNHCKKAPPGLLAILRKKWKEDGEEPVDIMEVECEFCSKNVTISCLGKHYTEVHELRKEDNFTCSLCGKVFKTREFYVCHLVGIHKEPISQSLTICRPYRLDDRDNGTEVVIPKLRLKKEKCNVDEKTNQSKSRRRKQGRTGSKKADNPVNSDNDEYETDEQEMKLSKDITVKTESEETQKSPNKKRGRPARKKNSAIVRGKSEQEKKNITGRGRRGRPKRASKEDDVVASTSSESLRPKRKSAEISKTRTRLMQEEVKEEVFSDFDSDSNGEEDYYLRDFKMTSDLKEDISEEDFIKQEVSEVEDAEEKL